MPMPHTQQDVAPFEYCIHVPNDPRAVSVARASLHKMLLAHGLPELIDRAELLATELLTNAIVHSGGEADIRISWTADEKLRLMVWDNGPAPLVIKDPDDPDGDGESGRGLLLLTVVADTWSTFPLKGELWGTAAKVVCCEIGRKPRGLWAL
ncbi:ATP-binding protein [Streptomyces sp. XD-27]|uniref:ATP-binding protein n=1 Tax=Streptomyces sp. XD-27 TaxID=3062779 RepID=UPI0026F47DFA|nr:ATP-binding protein [Streptomyces sp. XD-27]WKX71272.1 ATP-binding protein [Streptomyces sp. XD-27]